jgi:hypothetical protein
MPIQIRETTVTPSASGELVQLHISDAPPGDESATFVVEIQAKIPRVRTPALAQLQREAIEMTQATLSEILVNLATELQTAGLGLRARRQE